MPERRKSDSRRNMGTVSGVSAARIPREVKSGGSLLLVFNGFAYRLITLCTKHRHAQAKIQPKKKGLEG